MKPFTVNFIKHDVTDLLVEVSESILWACLARELAQRCSLLPHVAVSPL